MSEAEISSLLKVDRSDYYNILSCTRSSSAEEIKRAYRRLALKFHPDKNKFEGADEAFKMVAKAFSVLGEENKRAEYDRFGATEPGTQRSPFNGFARNRQEGEISPEELFNLFFGGMPGGAHFQFGFNQGNFGNLFNQGNFGHAFHQANFGQAFHQHQQQRQQHRTRPPVDPWTELKHKLLQILPILVFLVYSLLGVLFGSSSTEAVPKQSSKMTEFKEWVSLDYAPPHLRFVRKTEKRSVPYFSSLRFEQRFQPGHRQPKELTAFEEMIERGFVRRLQEACKREEGELAKAMKRVGRDEEAMSEVKSKHSLPSCTQLRQFFK